LATESDFAKMSLDDFFQDTNNDPAFKFWQIQKIFLISKTSGPALRHTEPSVKWAPGLFSGGKWAGT
jgi:hypothetical protein